MAMAGEYSSAFGQALMNLPQLLMGISKFRQEQQLAEQESQRQAEQLQVNRQLAQQQGEAQDRLARSAEETAMRESLQLAPGGSLVPEPVWNRAQNTVAGQMLITPPSTTESLVVDQPTGLPSMLAPSGSRFTIPTESDRLRTALGMEAGRDARADATLQFRYQDLAAKRQQWQALNTLARQQQQQLQAARATGNQIAIVRIATAYANTQAQQQRLEADLAFDQQATRGTMSGNPLIDPSQIPAATIQPGGGGQQDLPAIIRAIQQLRQGQGGNTAIGGGVAGAGAAPTKPGPNATPAELVAYTRWLINNPQR